MPETLKIFKNSVDQTDAGGSALHTENLVSTGATDQAVVRNVRVKLSSEGQAKTAKIKLGGAVLGEQAAGAGTDIDLRLTGDQIVDHSMDLVAEVTGEDATYIKANILVMTQSSSYSVLRSLDTTSTPSYDRGEDIEGIAAQYTGHSTDSVPTSNCHDLKPVTVDGVRHFVRLYNNNIYLHDVDTGAQTQDLGSLSVPSGTVRKIGVADNFVYGKSDSSNSSPISVMDLRDGTTSTISTNGSYTGPRDNTGGFCHYYDGHIYSKESASSGNYQKMDLATGNVSNVTTGSTGSYSHSVLVNVDGRTFIVSSGDGATVIDDLSNGSFVRFSDSNRLIGSTTNYGNRAMEVMPGVAAFAYNNDEMIVDLREGNPSFRKRSNSDRLFFVSSSAGTGNYDAAAAFFDRIADPSINDMTSQFYCDGIEITEA